MDKIKCSKCGYLNPADELMCGMCGEVFKKEKSSLGGGKVIEETPAPKTKKKSKAAAVEDELADLKPKAKTKAKARSKSSATVEPELIDEPAVEETPAPRLEQAPAAGAPVVEIKTAIRNFLQTEEFRQAVAIIAREMAPPAKAAPPPISPEELKSLVENKIDRALPNFLQSEAVLNLVREEVEKMPRPEAEAAPAISDKELEEKVGEILSKSAGRKGGGSLTIEAVELKVNAMVADIREKIAKLPADEHPPTLEEISKIVDNLVKVSLSEAGSGDGSGLTEEQALALIEEKLSEAPQAAPPSTDDLENTIFDRVRKFIEEQGTRPLPEATMDFDKVQAFVEAKIKEILPAEPAGGETDPAALKQEIQAALDKKFNSTEFSLLIMHMVQDAMPQGAAPSGDAAASISDEVLAAKLSEILQDPAYQEILPKPAEGSSGEPQLTARDVERIVNTRYQVLESDLISSELFKKAVMRAVQKATSSVMGASITPELLHEEMGSSLDSLRDEFKEMLSASLCGQLESDDFLQKVRALAAEEAAGAAPEAPAIDMSEIDGKIAEIQAESDAKLADALKPVEEKLDSLSAMIANEVEAHWQEKLSSKEIVAKISEVARQIAEGTVEARPALTAEDISKAWDEKFVSDKVQSELRGLAADIAQATVAARPELTQEDLSRAWDEKFSAEEAQEKLREIAAEIAQAAVAAHPELTEEDVIRTWDDKFLSEETQAGIRAIAAQEAAEAMPEIPSIDMSEIDEKVSQVQSEFEARLADAMAPVESEISAIPNVIEKAVETHWQEKLSSEEIVAKISEVARQIAEGTIEARPALTKEDISKAWDEKFSSEEAQETLRETAAEIAQAAIAAHPELTEEDVSSALDARLASEETLEKIRETARQIAEESIEPRISGVREEIAGILDEKLDQLTQEIQSKTADSLGLLEDQLAELHDGMDDTLSKNWRENLDSGELIDRITEVAGQLTEKMLGARPSLTAQDVQSEIENAISEKVSPLIEDAQQKTVPVIIEKASSLIAESITAALKEHLQSKDFGEAVAQVADQAALDALSAQPRLTPDNVREIAGGQFDLWIETYFKSEDFKEKVTEHIRKVAVEMLRDARTVILEDAEMRTGEQIEARLSTLEFVSPSALVERLKSLQTEADDRLKGLEESVTAAAEEKAAAKSGEIEEKLNQVVAAFEQDLKPFKKRIEELSEDVDAKLKPLYDEFKELNRQFEQKLPGLDTQLAQLAKKLPGLEAELAQSVKNSAASAVSSEQKLKSLANQLAATTEEIQKKADKMLAEKLKSVEAEIKKVTDRISSITPTDPESIERMIKAKVGDLPRQVEVFQKRLAALAEESLSGGGGGGGGGLGKDEIAALVLAEVEMNMKQVLDSPQFKKAVSDNITVGVEGGIDKQEFEQALRAFVQLETSRVAKSSKEMIDKAFDSDAFKEKVYAIAAASGGGGESGAPAFDPKELDNKIMEGVKKALDTKEVNLKIAQKFLEVMSYVKSEVPKIVAAAIKKQGG